MKTLSKSSEFTQVSRVQILKILEELSLGRGVLEASLQEDLDECLAE